MKQNNFLKFSIMVRNNDFIVRDYQLYQMKLVPPAAFLDVICRYLVSKEFAIDELVFKNIFFKFPTIINENNNEKISVTIRRDDDTEFWNIKAAASEVLEDGSTTKPMEIMTAELYKDICQPESARDMAMLVDSGVKKCNTEELYNTIRNQGLLHGEYLKLQTELFDCNAGIVGKGKLSTLASRYAKNYYIHPAYLDGALTAGLEYNDEISSTAKSGKNAYIVMYIESFKVYRALTGGDCYMLYPKDETLNTTAHDVLYVSTEIYDQNSNRVAAIEKASFKEAMDEKKLKEVLSSTGLNSVKNKSELAPEGSRERRIQDFLLNTISKIMECEKDKIDIDEDFFYIGLNSSSLLELVKELEVILKEKIYPTVFFENSTINKLSSYLGENYGEKFD